MATKDFKKIQNSFLKIAKERKTTYEYSSKKISTPKIVSILEAGRMAPSCDNTQPWYFIVVTDKKTINKLMFIANYGIFHEEPSLIIALVLVKELCSGPGHSCFRGDKYNGYDSWLSTAMAALNMVYQAKSLLIGSCLLTPERNKASKLLKLKDDDIVSLLIGFGYEKKGAFQKPKERRALKEMTFKDYFGQKFKF